MLHLQVCAKKIEYCYQVRAPGIMISVFFRSFMTVCLLSCFVLSCPVLSFDTALINGKVYIFMYNSHNRMLAHMITPRMARVREILSILCFCIENDGEFMLVVETNSGIKTLIIDANGRIQAQN